EVSYFEPVSEAVPEIETNETASDFAMTPADSFESADSGWETPVVEAAPSWEAPTVDTEASWEAPPAVVEPEPEPAVEEYAGNGNGNGHSPAQVPEPVVEVASAQPARSRFSDRNVDLPIDVSEDERRPHNDARRFARLLVSEIKLYNEQKVVDGREAGDLYDRLREAIDRSREMYDKRVQPQVASKFDYFHYELVNGLADGMDERLGQSYPGANI
ncbi:MAG TPA: hypothetical protein VK468_02960, partial [Pyrinomonadaceae bacterium]|nr:hypothetical protein [Pyrinomonadaceae bacterium]